MKVKQLLWIDEGDDQMALCPPSKPAFEGVSEGTHIAICNLVADLGMQDGIFGLKHQIYIRWEVPSERVSYQDEQGNDKEGAKNIGKTYGFSMHEKSNLRLHLESWRGKSFTDADLMDDQGNALYDVTKVIGLPCQISVAKNEKGTSQIKSVMGLPKGFPLPKIEGATIVYDSDNTANFTKLPEWMQKKISEADDLTPSVSDKVSDSAGHVNQKIPMGTAPPLIDEFDSDIPF